MYLIIKARDSGLDPYRLCYDNKWRSHAHIGSTGDSVKFYRHLGWAQRKASRIKGQVVFLPDGVWLDASGTVYDNERQRKLTEYVV